MKKNRKLQYTTFILVACVLGGCNLSRAGKAPESSYTVGVIDSANYGIGTTFLYLFDENLKETDTLKCPYYAVGSYGKTPVQIFDGVLYQKSLGNINKHNKCAIVSMDLQTGEWKDHSVDGKSVLMDFRVNENGIFTLGNANNISYVDYYPFPDGERVTVQVENTSGMGVNVDGYDVYFLGESLADGGIYLYHVDMEKQVSEQLLDVSKELPDNTFSYTQWHNGKLYIPNDDKLAVYDTAENEIRQIQLPDKYVRQILAGQDRLYLVNGDIANEDETDVYIFNPQTEEIETEYHFAENILQCHIQDGIFYSLEQDPVPMVRKYKLSPDGTYEKLGETEVKDKDDDGHRISDMFVK